jgi:DNA-binding PadR family transcriptional regulator
MRMLTTTEAAILGLLANRELSGYDLKGVVSRSVGYFWKPAQSQIYAVLPRLVERGLARRRDVRQEGRPDKQLYRITSAGRIALRDWLDHAPLEPEPERILLLKLFFGQHTDEAVILGYVRERRAAAEQLARELVDIDANAGTDPHDRFRALTRRYGLEMSAAVVRWAKSVETELA